MPHLVVVRHAQSEWNAAGRWQGHADPPLSSDGEAQARRAGVTLELALAAGALPGPARSMWSSPLRRAAETAGLLAETLGWDGPVTPVPELAEHDVGHWSGLTHDQIEQRWPGLIAAWGEGRLAATPRGEARAAFDARVRVGLDRVLAAVAPAAPGGVHVVVTHGGVLRAIDRRLGRPERRAANLEGLVLHVDADGHLEAGPAVALLDGDAAVAPPAGEPAPAD